MTDDNSTKLAILTTVLDNNWSKYISKKIDAEERIDSHLLWNKIINYIFIFSLIVELIALTVHKETYQAFLFISTFACYIGFNYFYQKFENDHNLKFDKEMLMKEIILSEKEIDYLLFSARWDKDEIYIIAQCLEKHKFTLYDVQKIEESILDCEKKDSYLLSWNKTKNNKQVVDIQNIPKIKQIRKFERFLKSKGYGQTG